MPARRTPKVEALVVNAIRRLQDVQGSTSREISNYISQEYNVPIEETRQQVQFALRRGLSYGILKCSKGGYYSCNRDYLGQFSLENGMGDGVMEPCPLQPWRKRGIERWRRKMKRRKREARERPRKRREEERRKKGRGRRSRGRSRSTRRRGKRRRRASTRRRSSRRRRRGRRSRSRRRGGRGRKSVGRARTRTDLAEIETETTSPELRRNDRADEDPNKSETSISQHSDERHSQNSLQHSQSLGTPDNN